MPLLLLVPGLDDVALCMQLFIYFIIIIIIIILIYPIIYYYYYYYYYHHHYLLIDCQFCSFAKKTAQLKITFNLIWINLCIAQFAVSKISFGCIEMCIYYNFVCMIL